MRESDFSFDVLFLPKQAIQVVVVFSLKDSEHVSSIYCNSSKI